MYNGNVQGEKRKSSDFKTFNNFANKRKRKSAPEPTYSAATNAFINHILRQKLPRGLLVFMYDEKDSPSSILHCAVDHLGLHVDVKSVPNTSPMKWQLSIAGEVIVEDTETSQTRARAKLAPLAVKELQKCCFSIIKKRKETDGPQVTMNNADDNTTKGSNNMLGSGGFGAKMMMKMGWKGGGLGSEEQGRVDIVETYQHVNRQGLGVNNIAQKFESIIKDYANSDNLTPLAFSSEFTIEERAQLHSLAEKYKLKSRSYGKGVNRKLVISLKLTRMNLVKKLMDLGGETEQYKLIYPTKYPRTNNSTS